MKHQPRIRSVRRVLSSGRISHSGTFFRGLSREQIVLLLGPVAVSVVLAGLYVFGMLPIDWPGLLLAIVLVNLAGDLAYALRDERNVRRGRVSVRNAIVGCRAVAEHSFTRDGRLYRGRVLVLEVVPVSDG